MEEKSIILTYQDRFSKVTLELDEDDHATLTDLLGAVPRLFVAAGYMPGSFPHAMTDLEQWVDTIRQKGDE